MLPHRPPVSLVVEAAVGRTLLLLLLLLEQAAAAATITAAVTAAQPVVLVAADAVEKVVTGKVAVVRSPKYRTKNEDGCIGRLHYQCQPALVT